jgi:hypothetical protein
MSPSGDVGEGASGAGDEQVAPDDEELLKELRMAAARHDPPPGQLPDYLEGLLSWRDVDAELADLVADSRELTGAVRDGREEILLRFEASPFAITFSAVPDGAGKLRLLGQIEPGTAGEIRVVQRAAAEPDSEPSELRAWCDPGGRFEAYPVAHGLISVRFTPGTGQSVRTAGVVL